MSFGQAWSGNSLTFGTATGDLTQLFPTWMATGVAKASAVNGDLIRKPTGGVLDFIQIQTDGTNGGIIEIWDINGEMIGANVSSATAITNAQLVLLQAQGKAKLLYSQNFTATAGAATPAAAGRVFSFGLAARFVAAAGACSLNLNVNGGAYLTPKVG
jgi:hypothetical protein